jgi:hypothetical protein
MASGDPETSSLTAPQKQFPRYDMFFPFRIIGIGQQANSEQVRRQRHRTWLA